MRLAVYCATRLPAWAYPVLAGLLYFATAVLSLRLTIGQEGLATFWPPSGVLFAIIFAAPPSRRLLHLAAAGIGSVLANLDAGASLATALGFTAANLLEPVLGVWLLSRRRSCNVTFTAPEGLSRFCKAATLATLISATTATVLTQGWSISFWASWFCTDLLGILTVAPLCLMLIEVARREQRTANHVRPVEIAALLTIVAATTIAVFAAAIYPLLFVPMLAVLFATFRLGPVGAAASVLIVSVLSAIAMSLDLGRPVAMGSGHFAQNLFFQAYLLALFAASLPIATLLAARRRLVSELGARMRLLEMAESAARVGHWRLDRDATGPTWSRETYRIHGLDEGTPISLGAALDFYHVDDRQRVEALVAEAIEHERPFEFTARIVRPSGEIRHVLSRGEIDRQDRAGVPGVFGIVQDITAQKLQQAALEEATRAALVLADTDQLTGIANRRRTSAVLAEALAAADAGTGPVAVAILDVDHFKRVNDTLGHQTGDAVLKDVAALIGAQLRITDTVGRFGGEEFVVILPNTSADQALMIAERVRAAIETTTHAPAVTVSIGVAEHNPGETIESLIKRADKAMYRAKRDGRNALRLAA